MKLCLRLMLASGICITLFSCGNSVTTAKEESQKADGSTATAATTEAAFVPFKLMLIKHKVADYEKWRSAYNAHDSVRKAYGLTDIAVSTAGDDPNTVLIAEKVSDLQKAKDFIALPNLKDAMIKAGVTGNPDFFFFDVIRRDESEIATKDRVMVTHRVKDFDAWVKVYDSEGTATRASEGMSDRMLARAVDDPNFVLITFAVTDMAKAKAAIFSEAKKKIMTSAGVEGVPVIEFYKKTD